MPKKHIQAKIETETHAWLRSYATTHDLTESAAIERLLSDRLYEWANGVSVGRPSAEDLDQLRAAVSMLDRHLAALEEQPPAKRRRA